MWLNGWIQNPEKEKRTVWIGDKEFSQFIYHEVISYTKINQSFEKLKSMQQNPFMLTFAESYALL